MFASTSPGSSRTGSRSSRTNSQSLANQSHDQFPELSDVPCYTCRRRHVKCDKILPHCAKCAKKGVTCSGYRKPLRWAEGVAVRGKFKGKTEPVVDEEAISAAKGTINNASVSIEKKAHYLGLHTLGHNRADSMSLDNTSLELINYYNTTIAGQHPKAPNSLSQPWKIESITPDAAQRLPRDILNCLMGLSAVHMAVRNPGNRAIERLALETKVTLFQGINNLFQLPRNQRADVLFICINLLFAMDSIEHGVHCWQTHALGAIKFVGSSEGLENLVTHFPHLKPSLAFLLRFDALAPILTPVTLEWNKVFSRSWLRTVCFDVGVQKHFSVTCPLPLMRALYDMANCAQNIVRYQGIVSAADTYTREWVLSDVLLFQPEDGVQELSIIYDRPLSSSEAQNWKLVFTAWRAATAIVVLRHLFLGVTEPSYFTQPSRSTTPAPPSQQPVHENPLESQQEYDILESGYPFPSDIESYSQEHLSPELQGLELSSYHNSPIPSPHHSSSDIAFDFFHRRYEVHNECFAELHYTLSRILEPQSESYLRYALLPLIVLGLVSHPHSPERQLSQNGITHFGQTVLQERAHPGPIGGAPLPFDIPWSQLDAFTAEEGARWQAFSSSMGPQLRDSSQEWNWLSMLQSLNMNLMWPICSGAAQQELGSEFWAFNVLSNCFNGPCFAALMQTQPSFSQSSTSL